MSRRFVRLVFVSSLLFVPGVLSSQATLSLTRPTATIDESFSNVVALQELPDGRVVVGDVKERRLVVLDFGRGSAQQLGRTGAGPNEYASVQTLVRGRADTLLLVDFPGRRILRIAPNGTLAGTVPLELSFGDTLPGEKPTGGSRIVSGPRFIDPAGGVFYEIGYIEDGKGVHPDRLVARWDPATQTSKPVVAIKAWYPDRSSRWRAPFMYQDLWAVAPDGRVARIVPTDYHVEWYKNGALVARGAPVSIPAVRVTKDDRDAWYRARAARGTGTAQMTGPPPAEKGGEENKRITVPRPPGFTDADFPATKPPFVEDFVGRSALISDDGALWVVRSSAFGATTTVADVFDAAGKVTRRVTFPSTHRLAGFGKSSIYLVRSDQDGLQWIERFHHQ
jgi:hypothetical protein